MFIRRLAVMGGQASCSGGHSCPEILELESGEVAVIGRDITQEAAENLPTGCGCGPGERVVVIPRALLVQAGGEITGSP